MSLFWMQRIVSLRLEQIQKDFLWSGGILERKSHLVDSTTVCSNKRKGALGVRCLSSLNKALLCKCSWWFAKEREVFWRQIVSGKHNREVEKEGKRKRAGMGGFLSERWVCGWNMEGHKEILRDCQQ